MGDAIKYEQFVDILNEEMKRNGETDFLARLQKVWDLYLDLIANGIKFTYYNDLTSMWEEFTFFASRLRPSIQNKCDNVKKIITTYLTGDIKGSIELLERNIIYDKALQYYIKYDYLKSDGYYYRLRSIDKADDKRKPQPYEPLALFHMPFELRGRVSTNRYSIPGYPCLYLGKSIYVCWEEMRRKDINAYAVVAMQCAKDIRLLDLRLTRKFHTSADCKAFLTMLPLIIACGMQVNNDEDQFKPEYILPQLLLHTVLLNKQRMKLAKENDKDDGIQYKTYKGIIFTSSVVDHKYNVTGNRYELNDCIVLPALSHTHITKGWSPDLVETMSISEPYVFAELEFLKDMQNYHANILKSDAIPAAEKTDDIYKGSYFYSVEKLLQQSTFKTAADLIKERDAKLIKKEETNTI